MNKFVIFFLLIFLSHSINCAEKKTPGESDELVKRTIVILPFLNKNDVKKFGYLSDTLREALKAKIIEKKIFNLINFSAIDERIKQNNIPLETALTEANAKALAIKLKADIAITGKYIIIEEKIMIQIDALDVFTGITAASVNVSGKLGLDLFTIIDESTVGLSEKLSREFKDVKKSYFTEMSEILKKEQMAKFFTPQVKAGISLCSTGALLFITGLPILFVDLLYYKNIFYDNSYNNPKTDQGYNEYVNTYYIYHSLLIGSITCISLGIVLASIGIPLIVYKKKEIKTGFNIEISNTVKFEFYIKI